MGDDFVDAVRVGLARSPKEIPCRFFYDEVGSELFEKICGLPEYYLTRAERSILQRYADEIAAGFDAPPALVELGSGSSVKTRLLIEAMLNRFDAVEYVP
ncbi:MAG: L-histidine N(alpha)-methyltransferase, partial [Planctomycetia bacterium]